MARIINSQAERLNDILQFTQIVCSNAGYSRCVNEKMLIDHQTYFDICLLIFSQLRIKIIKIQQNNRLTPAHKLQQLINLLSQELQIDEFDISGKQILQFNLIHIQKLLEILYECSKIYMESKKTTNVVKSETSEKKRLQQNNVPASSSARNPRRNQEAQRQIEYQNIRHQKRPQEVYHQNYLDQQDGQYQNGSGENTNSSASQATKRISQGESSYLLPEKTKKKTTKFSVEAKRARSQNEAKKNVHIEVNNILMAQKSKFLRAASRDNRKARLDDVKQAKKAYKLFLHRYTKENVATANRQNILKQIQQPKGKSNQLPLSDFEGIDNLFQSFAYKFRDNKAAYFKRIQRLVHRLQLDRFSHQNRLQRQLKKNLTDELEDQIKNKAHQHKVRSDLLKQQSKMLDQNVISIKKQVKLENNKRKKQLKQAKMAELKSIQNMLRQDNQKILMNFQQGSRLQQIIMKVYKRL